MLDAEFTNPLAYLVDSPADLARALVAAALIVAVIMLVRRNFKPAALFAVAAGGMALIAWDLYRVTTTLPRLGLDYGPITNPNFENPETVYTIAKSNQLLLLLSGILLAFLCVQIYIAARAKMTLTAGAGIVALLVLLTVQAEQIQYLGDMLSPVWHAMSETIEVAWTVLFVAVVFYVCIVGGTIAVRRAVKAERTNKPASPAASDATTVR